MPQPQAPQQRPVVHRLPRLMPAESTRSKMAAEMRTHSVELVIPIHLVGTTHSVVSKDLVLNESSVNHRWSVFWNRHDATVSR